MEVTRISEESSESNRIWEGYKKDRRELQKELDSIREEIHHLSALYEECRNLWIQGDFKRLSEALDKEGFRFFRELSEKLVGLKEKDNGALKRLERINKDLEEGIVCPECGGIGSVVVEKHYDRSWEQITPIIKTRECSLCKGSGKLRPDRPI